MSEENKHMDDSFKKMGEDLNASYDKSFWQDAKASLENDALDDAFRNAAAQAGSTAGLALASESLGDAFMDDAFQEAAAQVTATYSSAYWTALQASQPDLEMDDAFLSASKDLKASYSPAYWGAANSALEKEGLHYEYNSAYWNEARTLLDNADKKSFFTKWTGVAALLLLISLLGIYAGTANNSGISGQRIANDSGDLNLTRLAVLNATQENNETAQVQLMNDGASVIDENSANNLEDSFSEQTNLAVNNEGVLNNNQNIDRQSNPNASEIAESGNTTNSNLVEEHSNLENFNVNPINAQNSNIVNRISDRTPQNTNEEEPLNQETPNNIADQSFGLNNLSAGSLEPMHPEVNNADENNNTRIGNSFIEKMVLPVSLITPSSSELTTASLTTIEAPKLRNVHTFALLGGVGKGIGYGSESTIWTNRAYGGIGYNTYGFGKLRKFDFGVNVIMNYSDHEDLRRRWTKQIYRENAQTETNYVNYNVSELFSLSTNINAGYEFVPKHKLRLGMGLSKVVIANSIVASNFTGTERENNYVFLGSKSYISNSNNEVPEDFDVIDLNLTLGYEFQLSSRLSLQVTGEYGLFDRTNDAVFEGQGFTANHEAVFDNERSLTIGLKYNIFRVAK